MIEDPVVNDWLKKRFPDLKECVEKNYDQQLKEENAVLSTPEVEKIALQLGYWPRFVQYGSEIIRDWHQKIFSKKLDPAVEKTLKRTFIFLFLLQKRIDLTKNRFNQKPICCGLVQKNS